MARPKGQPKLGGRQKGTPNKTTVEARQAMANLVQENVHKFSIWLDEIYDEHGAKAAWDSLMDAVEFHVPKLSRTELTGADGKGPIELVINKKIIYENPRD